MWCEDGSMRGRVAEATESKLVQFDRRDSQLRRESFRRAKKIEGAATIDDAFSGRFYLTMLMTIATDLAVVPAPAVEVMLTVKEPAAAPPELEPPLEQPPKQSPATIKPSAATVLCTRRRLRQPKGSSASAKPKVEVAAQKRLSPTRLPTAPPVLIASMIVAGCTPSGVARKLRSRLEQRHEIDLLV
jgi:hypothetical protein